MRRHDLLVGSVLLNPTIRTTTADHEAANVIWYRLKSGNTHAIGAIAAIAATHSRTGILSELLGDAGVLVPVPKSSVHQDGALWVPQQIATALHNHGIGSGVAQLLNRHTAVPRSSGVTSSRDRPDARRHYESIEVVDQLYPPDKITLIDDVVTIGRTLMACALRLIDTFPGISVNAFAAARSVRHTHLKNVSEMVSPQLGTYRMDDGGYVTHDPPH